MSRKTLRKIKRRKRGKSKPKHRKSALQRHLSAPITNKWTKETTYALIVLDGVFFIWWLQDTMLNWQEIIEKLRNIFNILFGWIGG